MLPFGPKRARSKQLCLRSAGEGDEDGSSKRQRFWPCPVCNRTFPLFRLEDHVNLCLDGHRSLSPSGIASDPTRASSGNGAPYSAVRSPPPPVPSPEPRENRVLSSVRGDVLTSILPTVGPVSVSQEIAASLERTFPPSLFSDSVLSSLEVVTYSTREANQSTAGWIRGEDLPTSTRLGPCSSSFQEDEERSTKTNSCGVDSRGFLFVQEKQSQFVYESNSSGIAGKDVDLDLKRANSWSVRPQVTEFNPKGESGIRPEERPSLELKANVEEIRNGAERDMDRPPPGFKLFQRQVQSQARLSMFSKFSSSVLLQRKPTVTVLQPGMVLFRSWLSLEIQQKLVDESQGVAHKFQRPTTSGGGKYHVYSMCWGIQWDTKARRYVSRRPEELIPAWMFELSQKLAKDAQDRSPVYSPDSAFAPDVGLVNFYPVKADELGVIGLGGHQDLDDSAAMPVVSLSVGDSMTFFYRWLPPFSRRKSGVSISVDEKDATRCEDGDVSHNREHQILLDSGDVLVFGGQSRLVYHGTRHVLPGTRPPGLHMVPGRLNFTFRQTTSKIS